MYSFYHILFKQISNTTKKYNKQILEKNKRVYTRGLKLCYIQSVSSMLLLYNLLFINLDQNRIYSAIS